MRDAGSGAPIAGAVVSLTDSAGRTVARTISAANGRYRLTGDGSGKLLRAIHIGFRPATDSIPLAAAGEPLQRDLTLAVLPTLLEAVRVDAASNCPANADAPAAFALWEQVRSALLATVVAREANPPNVRVLLYDRILDRDGKHVERQLLADSVFRASRPFVSERSAGEYEARGYRDRNPKTGEEKFYGPDADILIDPAFIRAHCFSLRDDDASHPNEIGLAFSPAPQRDTLVDVKGVIWVRRTNPTLRSMDFRFTDLDRAETDAGAGGSLQFTEMPNGVLLGSSWNLHLPVERPAQLQVIGGALFTASAGVVAMRDLGGQVAEASWDDGAVWRDSLRRIRGEVVRAGTNRAVIGALVRLNADLADSLAVFHASNLEATTDSTGAFSFPPLLGGPYSIRVEDAGLAALGVPMTSTKQIVARDDVTSVSLALPSLSTAIDSLCGSPRRRSANVPAGDNLVVGRVGLPNGAPAESATVQVRWPSSGGGVPLMHRGATDRYGLFEVCGAPSGAPITFSATNDSLVSEYATLTLDTAPQIRLWRSEPRARPRRQRAATHAAPGL